MDFIFWGWCAKPIKSIHVLWILLSQENPRNRNYIKHLQASSSSLIGSVELKWLFHPHCFATLECSKPIPKPQNNTKQPFLFRVLWHSVWKLNNSGFGIWCMRSTLRTRWREFSWVWPGSPGISICGVYGNGPSVTWNPHEWARNRTDCAVRTSPNQLACRANGSCKLKTCLLEYSTKRWADEGENCANCHPPRGDSQI